MNQVHVLPDNNNWQVKADNNDAVLHTSDTQEAATEWARVYASDNGMELAVHSEEGEIRSKDSSGGNDDPNAPDNT